MISERKELGSSRLSIPITPAFTCTEIYIDLYPFQQKQQLLQQNLPVTEKSLVKYLQFFQNVYSVI